MEIFQRVKSVHIRRFFWSVFSLIPTKYREIQTRKNSVFGHILHSVCSFRSFVAQFPAFQQKPCKVKYTISNIINKTYYEENFMILPSVRTIYAFHFRVTFSIKGERTYAQVKKIKQRSKLKISFTQRSQAT